MQFLIDLRAETWYIITCRKASNKNAETTEIE